MPNWYIDAWCVADGLAFASMREEDSLEAEATVYLAPPSFEPESVGSITTALAATRGHFQAGYVGNEDREVAFTSLQQVIEAVRRAYLASSMLMEPDPGAAPAMRPTPLPYDGGPGGVYAEMERLERPVAAVGKHIADHASEIRNSADRAEIGEGLERLIPLLCPQMALLAADSMLTLLALPEEARGEKTQYMLTVKRWARVLDRVGFSVRWCEKENHLHVDLRMPGTAEPEVVSALQLHGDNQTLATELFSDGTLESAAADTGDTTPWRLLFSIPLPDRWQVGMQDASEQVVPVPSLGDLLCVALADRLFLERLEGTLHLVPLLFATLTGITSLGTDLMDIRPGGPSFAGHGGEIFWTEMCRRTAHWLARALPDVSVYKHQAEKDISTLITTALRQRYKASAKLRARHPAHESIVEYAEPPQQEERVETQLQPAYRSVEQPHQRYRTMT